MPDLHYPIHWLGSHDRRLLKWIEVVNHALMVIIISCLIIVPQASAEQRTDPAQTQLIGLYIDAVNRNDIISLKKIILPDSLKQINEHNQDFFEYMFENDLEGRIPPQYHLTIDRITDEEAAVFKDGFNYIVQPTHLMIIEYDESRDKKVTVIRQIVKQSDAWYFVLPDPNEAMLTSFHQRQEKEKIEEEKAADLFMKLADPLRLELQVLIDRGEKVEAYRLYSQKTGVELFLARRVIELLSGEKDLKVERDDDLRRTFMNIR